MHSYAKKEKKKCLKQSANSLLHRNWLFSYVSAFDVSFFFCAAVGCPQVHLRHRLVYEHSQDFSYFKYFDLFSLFFQSKHRCASCLLVCLPDCRIGNFTLFFLVFFLYEFLLVTVVWWLCSGDFCVWLCLCAPVSVSMALVFPLSPAFVELYIFRIFIFFGRFIFV